jgi:hypothetical protein
MLPDEAAVAALRQTCDLSLQVTDASFDLITTRLNP